MKGWAQEAGKDGSSEAEKLRAKLAAAVKKGKGIERARAALEAQAAQLQVRARLIRHPCALHAFSGLQIAPALTLLQLLQVAHASPLMTPAVRVKCCREPEQENWGRRRLRTRPAAGRRLHRGRLLSWRSALQPRRRKLRSRRRRWQPPR